MIVNNSLASRRGGADTMYMSIQQQLPETKTMDASEFPMDPAEIMGNIIINDQAKYEKEPVTEYDVEFYLDGRGVEVTKELIEAVLAS